MTGPFPEGVREPFSQPSEHAPVGAGQIDIWVAVLEFGRQYGGRTFLVADIQTLLGNLREWHPSGLWHPDRYAIQLLIPARAPYLALQWALAYHREAALAAGLPATALIRVEVCTTDDLERTWQESELSGAGGTVATTPRGDLLCEDAYLATRALLTAAAPQELTEIVVSFVTLAGGWVEPGPPRHRPDTIAVDVSIEGYEVVHARAEACSMAGLMLEQLLPTLVSDARRAFARLLDRGAEGDRAGRTSAAERIDP